MKQVIFQTDARGRWTLLNPAWTDLTGLSVEETLGRSFLDFVHPEDRQRQAGLWWAGALTISDRRSAI